LITTSTGMHGSIRWMAPELFHPAQAGRDNSRPTVESDVYALAMVMLEAFSGHIPFNDHTRDASVIISVTLGMQPSRPGPIATSRGLSDKIWAVIGECWRTDWSRRPSVPFVLAGLEEEAAQYVPTSEGSSITDERSDPEYSSDSEEDSITRDHGVRLYGPREPDESEELAAPPPTFPVGEAPLPFQGGIEGLNPLGLNDKLANVKLSTLSDDGVGSSSRRWASTIDDRDWFDDSTSSMF